VSPNDNFKRELNNAMDDVSGAPSSHLRDRVRAAVAEAQPERSTYWIAAVAACVITALIVGILYVNNPFRRNGLVGGNPTPTPSAATSPSPVPSPSPSPSPSPAPICTADTLPKMTPIGNPIAYVNAVRVAEHDADGYERITIQFANGFPTEYVELTPRDGTSFNETASGQTVKLKGSNGILIRIHSADMHTSYSGPTDWMVASTNLAEVRVIEDDEGYINIGAGLKGPACYHAYYLTNPARLVIDVKPAS
jgi:hypothetical protein